MSLLPLIIQILSLSFSAQSDAALEAGWQSTTIQIEDSIEYKLYLPWLINNSLTISIDDFILSEFNDYYWIDSTRTLIIKIEYPWMKHKAILVNYRSAKITDILRYQLYSLSESQDTLNNSSDESYYVQKPTYQSEEPNPFGDRGRIHRFGSISRGIQIRGNETTVSSGMHLEMSGNLDKDATIYALIDDRNISATNNGGSSTFSELDKIYFSYSSPTLKAELGDIDVDWQNSVLGKIKRQIKGASVSVGSKSKMINLIAAGNNNTSHRIILKACNGDHGPYELTNRDGLLGVQVSPGSERVYLNGKILNSGIDGAYLIDYRRGTISFTPTVLINSDSRIEIEYEYSDTNYSKHLFAGKTSISSVLSSPFSIQIATIIEGDDDGQPLLYEWTDEMKRNISKAGDNASLAVTSGIDSVGVGKGNYYYDQNKKLVYSQPDSLGNPTGYLSVIFSPDENGEYLRLYSVEIQTFYYEWADSTTIGDRWAPTRTIPLPERLIHNDIFITHSNGLFSSRSEIAISNTDQNTLSNREDADNLGVAWQWQGSWGDKNCHPISTTLLVSSREGNYNSPDRSVDPDYNFRWNLPDSINTGEKYVVGTIRLNPSSKFTSKTDVGYLKQGESNEVNRFGISAEYLWEKWQFAGSHNRLLRNSLQTKNESDHLSWSSNISREFSNIGSSYSYSRDKYFENSVAFDQSGTQRDHHSFVLRRNLKTLNEIQLRLEYFDENRQLGNGYSNWSDTRSVAGSWRRRRDSLKGWSADYSRSFTTYSDFNWSNSTSTNARIDAIRTFTLLPLTLQADYSLITGNDRIKTTIASYVGENQGAYRREDSRYVPDPNGEFDLHEAITDAVSSVGRVDFSSRITFGENALRYRGDEVHDYWLGFKGVSIRIEAELMSAASEYWKTFVLHPDAFRDDRRISSRLMVLQDYDFETIDRIYHTRLSFNWEEIADKNSYGGEKNLAESISILQRVRVHPAIRIELLPSITHNTRKSLLGNDKITNIYTSESQLNCNVEPATSQLETGLSFRYTSRKDKITDHSAIIREWKPWVHYLFKSSGSVRFNAAWIRLTSLSNKSWYDIDRGWQNGNNYKLGLSWVNQIYENVNLNFYYRGLWGGDSSLRHEGLLEFTATL